MIRPVVVEGLIAVANHKLRVESLDDYKEFLGEKYYSEKDVKKIKQNIIEYVKDWYYNDTDKKDYTDWDIKELIDKLAVFDAEGEK